MKTMTDPRCGKVSRANDTDGHCTRCHLTWSGENAFTAHQHIADGVLTCEDPATSMKPDGSQKWWPRLRPGTTDGVAWGLGEPGWHGSGPTVAPVVADAASPVDDSSGEIWVDAPDDFSHQSAYAWEIIDVQIVDDPAKGSAG